MTTNKSRRTTLPKTEQEVYERFIKRLVGEYTTKPVEVEYSAADNVLLIRADKSDQGKILGNGGRNARALETIVETASKNWGDFGLTLRILEPTQGVAAKSMPFVPDPNWDKGPMLENLLQDTLEFMFPDISVMKLDAVTGPSGEYEIHVGIDRKLSIAVQLAIDTLWNAIGKASGRNLLLCFEYQKPAPDAVGDRLGN